MTGPIRETDPPALAPWKGYVAVKVIILVLALALAFLLAGAV